MSCVEGNIYWAATQASSFTRRPHIVLRCLDGERVAYVYTTCQVAKLEALCRIVEGINSLAVIPETMVKFDQSDSPAFTKPCAVNCNNVWVEDWSLFISSTSADEVGCIAETDKMSALIKGVLASSTVHEKVRKLFIPQYPIAEEAE